MSDPGSISRLDKLRALQEWLDWQLRQTRGRIRELEAQERQGQQRRAPERQRGREQHWQGEPPVENRESGKRRPRAFPDWGITDIGIGTLRSEVHRGDCFAAGKQLRAISREQALAALALYTRRDSTCPPVREALGAVKNSNCAGDAPPGATGRRRRPR
ncbi:DUF6233 domain-containing protein [Streptomyces sp. NPDC057565]|uniref:DUF6233 domain-containing protein n=1 Tax=Streptomyces sp. NPDC057565 TaxID=3346169 RepID=UPI0036A8F36F